MVADRGLVLQPANGKNPGSLFLVDNLGVDRIDLTDSVITSLRTELHVPPTDAEKGMSNSALNYAFVNDIMKAAIESNSYTITDNVVTFRFMINGVQYSGSISGFRPSGFIDVLRTLTKELHKQYDSVTDMIKTAREKGIELELESTTTDFDIAEQMRKKQLTAKYFSSVRPGVRSASVKKGFKYTPSD